MGERGWIPQSDDTFAKRLQVIRMAKGLTVEQTAEMCGVPTATWSTWERGTKPRDFIEMVNRIAAALGVDLAWLAFGPEVVGGGPVMPATSPWVALSGQGTPDFSRDYVDLASAERAAAR